MRRTPKSHLRIGESGRKITLSTDGIYHSERKITLWTDWIQEKHNGKWTPCTFGDFAQIQGFLRCKFCFRAPKSMAAEVPAVTPDPARRSKSILFQRILIKNRCFFGRRPLPTRPGAQHQYFLKGFQLKITDFSIPGRSRPGPALKIDTFSTDFIHR